MKPAKTLLPVRQWIISCEEITRQDPLLFDTTLATLHALNRDKDIKGIVQLLYRHLPSPVVLDDYTYEESIAAMRDLGFFIGILKRHGVEPVEAVPELEYVLLVLMVKTNLPPRDTLIHYTMWNPGGSRQRTYSGTDDELHLIESVKLAYPSLMEAIAMLDLAHDGILEGLDFNELCLQARNLMTGMVRGVVYARKNVSTSFFAKELRFYYDPIRVDYDREYLGPGAVEMPVFVFDHLLWSSDCQDEMYNTFKEGYLPYNLQIVRDIYDHYKEQPSLVSRIMERLRKYPSKGTLAAAKAVQDLCTVLKSFRMPHKRLAEEAYAHNENESQYDHGSGGYSVGILQYINSLQNNKFSLLNELVNVMSSKVIVS